ncbi:MAG: outer membrane protein assembly factor BamB [Arenicella sp.]|jgi:outer membrane protein assembly factor BamB
MSGYILISGGRARKNGFELGEGKYYDCAKLLKLELATGKVNCILEKKEGGPHYPDEHPNLQYTSACLVGDTLWLPTDTEIYKMTYPELQVSKVISCPFFHNIHSVNVFNDKVYATSTGLDLVAVFDLDGELLELINAEGKEVWHRFSKDVDYRLTHSTRPHDCHPNFVFEWKGKAWVTRCKQQDAVCLEDVGQKIELTTPEKRISVHDGLVYDDKVYFTTVDGFMVIADPDSREIVEQIDLLSYLKSEKLGWARGISISKEGIAYIGFSRIRRTKMQDKLAWLAKGQISKMKFIPACVLAFDLNERKILAQYDIPFAELDAIYGIEYTDI